MSGSLLRYRRGLQVIYYVIAFINFISLYFVCESKMYIIVKFDCKIWFRRHISNQEDLL